jgi:hypothetical protein
MSLVVAKTGIAEYGQERLLTGPCSLACACKCVRVYNCVRVIAATL